MTPMDPVHGLARGATGALRLGRGLADRAIRMTGPRLARAVGRVADGAPIPRRTTRETTPATFTPSERPGAPEAGEPVPGPVTPGSVARNISNQRPAARGAGVGPARKSVPGAKLPPRRPSTTA